MPFISVVHPNKSEQMTSHIIINFNATVVIRLPGFKTYCYDDRLGILCLPSLELRRLHIDLIMCNKIVFGIFDVKFDDFFKRSSVVATRGHAFKLFKEHSTNNIRQAFFSQSVINIWNALPETADFSSLWSFKRTVKLVDFTSFLKCF